MARGKSKGPQQPAWRPNFRNAETLPDIKVVRTHFLINVAAVSLAAALLIFLAYREYLIADMAETVNATRANIAASASSDRRNVRASGEFQKLEREVSEVSKFLNVPVAPDELILVLASVQPPEMILDSLSFSPSVTRQGRRETIRYQIVLNGTVADAPGTGARPATDIITEYRNAFGQLDLLAPYFENSELSGFSRNELLGLFNFTIRVTLSMEPKAEN